MIIDKWENYPVHRKVALSYIMPDTYTPVWVIASENKREDSDFLTRFRAMQGWVTDNDLPVFLCSLTCVAVFMNDSDLVQFKLTWL